MNSSIPWVEKYRPDNFDNIVLDRNNEIIFNNIIDMNLVPNLLLYGPPGTGKTTTLLYMLLLYARKYGLKFLIYSAENEATSISKKLCEFLVGLPFNKIEDKVWKQKIEWVHDHFRYIDIDETGI